MVANDLPMLPVAARVAEEAGAPGGIGVDIEAERNLSDLEAVARRFFARDEVQRLEALPGAERRKAFFECWSRKEAVLKATGEGISEALPHLSVAFGPDRPDRFHSRHQW